MSKTMASEQLPSCLEAARAAALASHSAASLAAAAGFKEAARLLRSSEALSRAAVATLTAAKVATTAGVTTAAGQKAASSATATAAAPGAGTRGRRSRKKVKDVDMGTAEEKGAALAAADGASPSGPPLAAQHRQVGEGSLLSNPDSGIGPPGPYGTLPKRSPQIGCSGPPSSSTSSSLFGAGPGTMSSSSGTFVVGQAVLVKDLVGKKELNGLRGSVLGPRDPVDGRYAIRLGSGTKVRARSCNLRPSIFPGG